MTEEQFDKWKANELENLINRIFVFATSHIQAYKSLEAMQLNKVKEASSVLELSKKICPSD